MKHLITSFKFVNKIVINIIGFFSGTRLGKSHFQGLKMTQEGKSCRTIIVIQTAGEFWYIQEYY